MTTITVTKTCPNPGCNRTNSLDVDADAHARWKGGMFIQQAMPDLDVDRREFLISGCCYDRDCYEQVMADVQVFTLEADGHSTAVFVTDEASPEMQAVALAREEPHDG